MTSDTTRANGASVDTSRQQTWANGDYARIGNRWLLVSELLCESVGIPPGGRVLDVATGTGNAALAAARRFGVVTGIDYVPGLIDQAAERAAAERLEVTFEVGDARRLPYRDDTFDVVLSTFGVMFVPDQARAAAELSRVLRPGGRIGLANWVPDGFMGRLFELIRDHVPPPPDLPLPTSWGTEGHVRRLFGRRMRTLEATERRWIFRFRSVADCVSYFGANFGPLHQALDLLSGAGGQALLTDVGELVTQQSTADGGTVRIPSPYLEVVAEKAA